MKPLKALWGFLAPLLCNTHVRELKLKMSTQLVKNVLNRKEIQRIKMFPLEMNTGLPKDGGALFIHVTSGKKALSFGGWPLHNVLTDSWRTEPAL